MSLISLRPARRSDAADLALLDNIAGHGISIWFWQKEVPSGRIEDALAFGRSRMAGEQLICGWTNSFVAEQDGVIVGSIASYLMPESEISEDSKKDASAFAPVYELFEKVVGYWLIDSLAIYPSAQGQGVGRRLLENSLARAREQKVKNAALVVEDSNTVASKLYRSLGFEIQDKREFIEFEGKSETREWLLMTVEL